MSKTTIEVQVEEIMKKLCLYGKITEGHAQDVREVLFDALTTQQEEVVKEILERLPESMHPVSEAEQENKTFMTFRQGFNNCLGQTKTLLREFLTPLQD